MLAGLGLGLRAEAQQTAESSAASAVQILNPNARAHVSLNGPWSYLVDPLREGLRANVHSQYAMFRDEGLGSGRALREYNFDAAPTLNVPGSWTSQVEELHWYEGLVWLRRRFEAAPASGRRQFLYFGAANYEATVFLNGERLGAHRGGFTPFAFEVTGKLRAGDNSLVVAVDSAHGDHTVPPTRTDWWNYGGLTRPVMLIETPQTFLSDYWLRLGEDGESIAIDIALDGPRAAGRRVRVSIPELRIDTTLRAGADGRATASLRPRAPIERWSPEQPKLYDVRLSASGETVQDRIGFRTIQVVGDDILLNGRSIFLRGISMHEETLGENPDRWLGEDGARELLTVIKEGLNGNFVRLAHYPHAEETLRVADEMGLLVWSEIPVYWDAAFDSPEVLADARAMLHDNIMRDRNRAAIVIWSVANETPIQDDRNRFLSALIQDARTLDGTRLVSLASNRQNQRAGVVMVDDPLAEQVDLLSVNYYSGWYGGRLEDLATMQWQRRIERPLVLSEFGAGANINFSDPEQHRLFSLEYQRDYYEATIGMARNIPFLRGASPWVLKDFRSPRRFHPVYQQYFNRKGVITPTGERKPAFEVLRAWYDEIAAAYAPQGQ